jgi:hypothetical protein
MKIFLKIFSISVLLIFLILSILVYGFSTDKFNKQIISQIEKRVPNSNADFDKANISLDIFSLNLKIKIEKPLIQIDEQKININHLTIFTDLKSSFEEKYLLQKIIINFDDNKILDLKKTSFITKVPILDQTKFLEGSTNGNLIIDGLQAEEDTIEFKGQMKNVSIDIYEDLPFAKNITGQIEYKNNKVILSDIKGEFGSLKINSKDIKYSVTENNLAGNLNINGPLNSSMNLKKISLNIFDFDIEKINEISGEISLLSNLDIQFDKNYKVKNDKSNFVLETQNLKFKITEDTSYDFDQINSKINFDRKGKVKAEGKFFLNTKSNNFLITKKDNKSDYQINLNGEINLKETFFKKTDFLIKDDLNYKITTQLKDFENYKNEIVFDLKNSEVDLPIFNYVKNKGVDSQLKLIFEKSKKNYKVQKLNFTSLKNQIFIGTIALDKDLKLKDFNNIKIKLGDKNQLEIKKDKKNYNIKGNSLDLTKILKERGRNKDLELNTLIDGVLKVDLKKIHLPDAILINYKNTSTIKKGEFVKLNSFANFEDLTTFIHEIKTNQSGNKELILRSEKAKPFVSNYEFLNGLQGGTLDIKRETLSKDFSVTEIKLNNFYLKEMPILTQILSVASLTGILDTLEGKGVFFKEAYLKYELLNNELKIVECYGTGPSLGFIIEGRVGADDFTSLNGTIAPANTINNIVRGIPFVGKILTGKKGDGIFGASFKIKGKDELKTEVNPIRTITPRFIQRFIGVFKN